MAAPGRSSLSFILLPPPAQSHAAIPPEGTDYRSAVELQPVQTGPLLYWTSGDEALPQMSQELDQWTPQPTKRPFPRSQGSDVSSRADRCHKGPLPLKSIKTHPCVSARTHT